MKYVISISLLLFFSSFNSSHKLTTWVYSETGRNAASSLVLNSDHIFYYMQTWGNCYDTDDYYLKGSWSLNKGVLQLKPFNSFDLPKCNISQRESVHTDDSITIVCRDYIGLPINNITIVAKRIRAKNFRDYDYPSVNDFGVLRLARKEYAYFYLRREDQNFRVNRQDTMSVFTVDRMKDSVFFDYDWPLIGEGSNNKLEEFKFESMHLRGTQIYNAQNKLRFKLYRKYETPYAGK